VEAAFSLASVEAIASLVLALHLLGLGSGSWFGVLSLFLAALVVF